MPKTISLKTALGSRIHTLFHPRELHLHDARGVRHIRISTRVQVTGALVATAVMGWTLVATATVALNALGLQSRNNEIAMRDRQIAAMQADVARIQQTADAVAGRVEARQQFLAGLISGRADPARLAALLPESSNAVAAADGRYAQAITPLTEIEGKQLAFVSQATSTVEARYRETQALLQRLGLTPSRFVRQSRISMGGPYEPVGTQDTDPAFRKLFTSWTRAATLERAMLSVPALKPVKSFALTSGFGVRYDPFSGGAAMHSGVDMAGPVGEPIYATADGVVEKAGWGGGYGNMIDLGHGRGIETRYGHLSKILVTEGQKVKRGDLIGRMGSTGRSTGSHLHYEVRIDGRAVNPVPFLQSAEQLAAVHSRALDGVGGPALPAVGD